jgi:hypothetical protein
MVPREDEIVDLIKYPDGDYHFIDGYLIIQWFLLPKGLKRLNNGPRYFLYERMISSGFVD